MTVKTSTIHYNDCRRVMEAALLRGGATIEFAERNRAVNFRNRCYAFRKLLHDMSGDAFPTSKYDALTITIRDESARRFILLFEERKLESPLRDLEGNIIELEEEEDLVEARMPDFDPHSLNLDLEDL